MIDQATLQRIVARASELTLSESSVQHLRREWPGLHFTLCSEDDVPARLKPACTGDGFAVYFVSNASHCVAFTEDSNAATGVVLAAYTST